jgi:uncharacterized membrane protein (DUF485 family)
MSNDEQKKIIQFYQKNKIELQVATVFFFGKYFSNRCTMMSFFKTFMEQHVLAKGAHFSIILGVHIHHFAVICRN